MQRPIRQEMSAYMTSTLYDGWWLFVLRSVS
jgi:hypothetical protein